MADAQYNAYHKIRPITDTQWGQPYNNVFLASPGKRRYVSLAVRLWSGSMFLDTPLSS
jgi:hypothetical protein